MRFAYRQKIGTRLGLGFAIVVGFTILLGIFALIEMRSQANTTRDLYNHPLVVSNAILDIRGNILAMHRSMRDFILTGMDAQGQDAINQVEQEEQKALHAFDTLYDRFLGDKADVDAARKAFMDWKLICSEEIDLVEGGKKDQAAQLAEGKGAEQVVRIDECIQVVSDFARQKARVFFNRAQKTEQQHFWFMLSLVLLISASGVMGGILITRSITGPLDYVVEQIRTVAAGNLDHKINLNSDDEIGGLARTFDKMTASLKKVTASRNEFDAANQQLGAANQQLRAHEQQLRAANQQLRASEQHRESIISTVPGVVYRLQMDSGGVFSIPYISSQAENIIGHPLSILTNSDCFFDIIHSEDVDNVRQSILDSAGTLESCTVEFRVFDTHGRLRWLKSTSTPQRFDDNNTVWNGIIVDITDRKQDEVRLLESEERYRIVADNTYDWEFWIDHDDRYAYISPSCQRITGYTAEEFKTDPDLLKAIIHPDDRQSHQAHAIKVRTQKTVGNIEFRIIHKEGQICWIEQLCQPVFGKDGKWLGTRGSNRDATKRKQAEETLQKTNDLLRAIIEAAPAAIIGLDLDGKVQIIWNPAAEKMLGWSAAEVMGKYLPTVSVDKEEEFHKFRDWIRSGKTLNGIEVQRQRRDGTPIDYSIYASPLHGPEGQIIGNIAVLVDITDRKRAEEMMHQLNRELRAISDCNQVLVRAQDEQILLNNICRIICDEAGYRMAWVGYAEQDDAKTVRPVAWAGVEEDYLVNANITWADNQRGRGPTGTAIRSGESVCIHDFATDPKAAPWRENAMQVGYRSSIALPLKDENNNTFGTLNIYSAQSNAFTPDEIRLLEELSGDLAFGITILRVRVENKRAEEALKESEVQFRSLFDAMSEGVALHELITDKDGKPVDYRIIDVNPAYEKHTGLSAARARNQLASVLYGAGNPPYLDLYTQVVQTGKPMFFETSFSPLKKYFDISVFSPRPGWFATIFMDITQRKQIEWELRRNEEKFMKTFRNNPAIMVISTIEEGRLIEVNDMFIETLGYERQEVIGKTALELNLYADPGQRNLIVQSVKDHGDVRNIECLIQDRAGQLHCGLISAEIIEFQEAMYLLIIMNDVTERKKAEELLQLHQANMAHLLRLGEVGEMASGLAHEINQPLCAIENYAQACLRLMETNPDTNRLGDAIKDIRAQAERAGKIIHRIKGLVRKRPPRFEHIRIKDIIQEANDLISAEAKKRGIQILVNVPDNLTPVYADFILVEQVVLNLIRNSLDALDTPQICKKDLTIQAQAGSNSMIEVSISDTGCGISEKNMKRIFESFFTTKPDGLGIGLPLSRAIIESHSGQIWATANADGGTTFYFTLSTRSHTDGT
jgi:PAS domain S-box-containing protein